MLRRKELALLAGLLLTLVLTPLADFTLRSAAARENVLRLHILASSDQPADQQLKYQVRDAVLQQSQTYFSPDMTLDEMEQAAAAAIPELVETANTTLAQAGSTQQATARLDKIYFGTRSYDGITYPAGFYTALQITLGEGQGKNWWCVMYPPVCLPAAKGETTPQQPGEMVELDKAPRYKMAFATVELLEKLGLHTTAEQ